MLMSSPNLPSVKYHASIYPKEDQFMVARTWYLESYKAKPPEYKLTMKTEAFCIPFNSFPIIGMPKPVKV